MTPKKQFQQLIQTIQDTITLLQTLTENPDYTSIRQLGWNLGWQNGVYHLEITEDPYYDSQALNLATKILQQILETTQQ